ncbi:glycosyltransferase family 2 protein [Pontibacter amylolyticus]|uniref:Hemolytic protein HlpA n=1 Tax=Pontibacter amylolyticus TaxID=1424080 RepID=A0ABQ1WEE6_9BACT|nr:glycosyltransferase family 2 protein [Pontibacter amylolyticus]GGG26998.1 hemolytic protein HlpA [Pontibacter amylolyticus]
MCTSPILFLIFNRPDNTARVFNAIRKARPTKLYVAADGPRPGNASDADLCARTRDEIKVDWDCELHLLFRDENLGCKNAVSSAIDWFFKQEPEGIVLEDDCLPNSSFFRFCDEMLKRYRHDERVMMVSGDNFQPKELRPAHSYYFSTYANIWGWASWRRAWVHYDVNIKLWPTVKEKKIHRMFSESELMPEFWEMILQDIYDGKLNTWDYQWNFACKINHGLSIVPKYNLISNIGVGAASTHTDESMESFSELETQELEFPLTHPQFMYPDKDADKRLVKLHYHHLKKLRYRHILKKKLPNNVLRLLTKLKQKS